VDPRQWDRAATEARVRSALDEVAGRAG
jgi:hypothetical protein